MSNSSASPIERLDASVTIMLHMSQDCYKVKIVDALLKEENHRG